LEFGEDLVVGIWDGQGNGCKSGRYNAFKKDLIEVAKCDWFAEVL
jgi:hypothetical protein